MSPTILTSNKCSHIKLVSPTASYDESVAKLRSDVEIRRYLRFFPEQMSIDDARLHRESRANNASLLDFHILLMKDDGSTEFVGSTLIFDIELKVSNSCEAGILVLPEVHRGGIATAAFYILLQYAFDDRKMHRVAFQTGRDNVGMRGWLEKVAGAKLEGVKRECWKDGNSYSDCVLYSILEGEWQGGIKEKLEARLESASSS